MEHASRGFAVLLLALVPFLGGDISVVDCRARREVARIPAGIGPWGVCIVPAPASAALAASNGAPRRLSAPPDSDSAEAAVQVLRDYYAAIEARRYRDAWGLWAGEGRASRQTYDRFAAGFANTAHVQVETGSPGPIGAAAGSRYVEVPVAVDAVTGAGARQRFAGRYTLRRSVVDGATAEQRSWRIDSAALRPAR